MPFQPASVANTLCAVPSHNTVALEIVRRANARKLRAIAGNGADPERHPNDLGRGLETDIKLRSAELFAEAATADEQRSSCASFVGFWGSLQGSFRFDEYYERLMSL